MAPVVEAVTSPVVLGEGPHWDERENALFFVSILEGSVHKYLPETGKHTRSSFDDVATFIIPVEGRKDHFVIGLKRKVVEVVWDGTEGGAKVVRTITEVDQEHPKNRFNDAKADPRGRLFAGTMGSEYAPNKFEKKKGSLYRVDPDGTAHRLVPDVDIANGLCWDVQEKAFYFVDSFEYTIRRYDYDIETGNISNPRHVFKCSEHGLSGILDGMTIDTNGHLWVVNHFGGQVLHIDPRAGKLLQKIPLPSNQVTSLTFGGPNLDTFYVTSACLNHAEPQPPPSGAVYKLSGLGVKGYLNVRAKID